MGDELTLESKAPGIDAVWLEDAYGAVADGRSYEQREKEVEATSELGAEEDTHERSVHHATHDSCHTHHGEVHFGQEGKVTCVVEHYGKEESCEVAEEERWSERTTAASTAIGSSSGKCLAGHDEQDEQAEDKETASMHQPIFAHRYQVVEYRLFGNLVVCAVIDVLYCLITFAIERRKKEDGTAEEETSNNPFLPWVGDFLELVFCPEGATGEVERRKATEHTKQKDIRDSFDCEVHRLGEIEQSLATLDSISHACCCDSTDEERHDRRCRKVEHQHLDREQESSDRSLEDAGNTSSGATTQKYHHGVLVETEGASEVAANGRACEHDRSLGTDRTTKADGDARCKH